MQGLSLMVAIFMLAYRPASPATIVRTEPAVENQSASTIIAAIGVYSAHALHASGIALPAF
jgi:hypothetical protein